MKTLTILCIVLIAAGASLLPAAEPFSIGTDKVVWRFASDGRPQSFRNQGREMLNEQDPGPGFELNGFDFSGGRPVSFPFKTLHYDGRRLVASLGDTIRVTCDVQATDRYIACRIVRVEGVPKSNLLWLRFRMNVHGNVKTIPLDYMTRTGGRGCEVEWPWLWDRKADSILGGFAIYAPADEADEDETLLHIWAREGLPHPQVKGTWDVETARKWLAEWQRQFADQSQMLITAHSNQELYRLADFAATLDIRRIYMHTDTWRGEYWPVKFSFLHLNPRTFPNGEADFQKFAAYARGKGIGLTIHTVSCAIANEDPDYVVGHIDPRLAKWIDGTLAQSASATDRTIAFRPAPGGEMPMNLDRPVTGPANVDPWNNIRMMRLGDEFISVGSFSDTDKDVWTLKDCRRGVLTTTAVPHAAATGMTGLIRPYDQCFTADNDSTLVSELGRRIAEFCNRNNIIHCEQDAGEIHTVNHQWGYAKFAEAVYTRLDHPVTSNNSGGSPMPCQFEYRFNSSKTAIAARNQPQVPLTLARNGRLATGPYEMCTGLGRAAASGVRSFGIYKPEPMFGVSTETLENHGLASLAADTVVSWKRCAPLLDDAQRKAILAAGDEVLHRAARTARGLEITPLRMLSRPGIDIGWKPGSEFGPIVPRQYVRIGEALQVENPYADQEPEFLIRVMDAFNEDPQAEIRETVKPAGDAAAKDRAIIDAYNTGTGVKNAGHPLQEAWHIWARDAVVAGEAGPGKCWLRKRFTWSKAVAGRVDFICHADDEAVIWVNGRKLPGTGGDWRTAFATDITSCLQEGDNLIAIEADNSGGGAGCVTAGIVFRGDAATTVIPSDRSWRSSAVSAKKWKEAAFDDSAWKESAELKRFGEGVWGRPVVAFDRKQQTRLQPKAEKIRNLRDHQIADAGEALRIQFDNKRNETILNQEDLPFFDCSSNMASARGVGLTVTGDGSGAVLVLQVHCPGPRDYIVPLDFKGVRTCIIPCGEVAWADARWGWRMDTKGTEYGRLGRISIGLGKVPPRTHVDIQVADIRILPEIPVALQDPVVQVGGGSLQIRGSIPGGSYVWYQGGDTIGVYDANWNRTAALPVVKSRFIAPKGRLEIRVACRDARPVPWLECQFFVKDAPLVLGAATTK